MREKVRKTAKRRVVGECKDCFPKTRKTVPSIRYDTVYVTIEMAVHRLYGITTPVVGAA